MFYTEKREESCLSKNAYDSKDEAEEICAKQASKSGKALGIYKCDRCGFYHITSKKWN